MAIVNMLVDDFDGTEAVETIHFGLDGKDYAVDLSAENVEWLRETMAPVLAVARKLPKSASGRALAQPRQSGSVSGRSLASKPAANPKDPAYQERMAIRDWARENGWPDLSNQGVIAKDVKEAYVAAHPDPSRADLDN